MAGLAIHWMSLLPLQPRFAKSCEGRDLLGWMLGADPCDPCVVTPRLAPHWIPKHPRRGTRWSKPSRAVQSP
jgi:hypothetical protein